MHDTIDGHLAFAVTRATDISALALKMGRRPHELRIIEGTVPHDSLLLKDNSVVVGRSEKADFRVMSADLSRLHARLQRTRRGYECRDLGSRNGVYVNTVQVESAILRDGDRIQLGNVVFLYLEGS